MQDYSIQEEIGFQSNQIYPSLLEYQYIAIYLYVNPDAFLSPIQHPVIYS